MEVQRGRTCTCRMTDGPLVWVWFRCSFLEAKTGRDKCPLSRAQRRPLDRFSEVCNVLAEWYFNWSVKWKVYQLDRMLVMYAFEWEMCPA